jgi:sporulation protein YlmC with PRC-barrel domain
MAKTEKALTRDRLNGMEVIDADGKIVGKVKDVAFAVGKTGISLSVENEDGDIRNIPWEDIQAAGDYIVLKPVPQVAAQLQQPVPSVAQPQPQAQQATPLCPTCGRPLNYIQQYQRWYCYNEKKYV